MYLSKKEACKKIMMDLFGPATSDYVDTLTEENCVEVCKNKVLLLLGPEKAKLFDKVAKMK